jgi:hypothetical protein
LEVTLLLCDAADEANGKLYVMGGGWTTVIPDQPVNMALALLVEVPWDQANRKFNLIAKLMTDDGEQVQVEGEDVGAGGDLEVGRPAGLKPGTPLNLPLALKFSGVSLPAGGYRWEVHVDGTLMAKAPFRAGATT